MIRLSLFLLMFKYLNSLNAGVTLGLRRHGDQKVPYRSPKLDVPKSAPYFFIDVCWIKMGSEVHTGRYSKLSRDHLGFVQKQTTKTDSGKTF